MKKVTVAMSGGVDSGAAALLLREAGYDCHGVTFDMNGGGDAVGDGARAICDVLGIPHVTEDASEDFMKYVRAPFAAVYESGATPNPCVLCNRDVKFPRLLRSADRLGTYFASTGHYARTGRSGDVIYIRKGADPSKDQSYMLWALSEDVIRRLIFPLGEYTKPQIRELAMQAGLPCHASPDSQDICFIPDGDLRGYLDSALGTAAEGNFTDADGNVLGKHCGQRNFTVGQGRGLGIALGRRVYVIGKDPAENRVILGDEAALYRTEVKASGIRLGMELEHEERLSVKLRYTRTESVASVWRSGEDEITARFDSPVRAPASGQSMVLYDGDAVVGGGIII